MLLFAVITGSLEENSSIPKCQFENLQVMYCEFASVYLR